jgi:hypothetical protein
MIQPNKSNKKGGRRDLYKENIEWLQRKNDKIIQQQVECIEDELQELDFMPVVNSEKNKKMIRGDFLTR